MNINELPALLEDSLPSRVDSIRKTVAGNRAETGELLFYPILSLVVGEVLADERRSDFSDRSELRALFELAEHALVDGDDRLKTLFTLEFIDAFAEGVYPGVPIQDLLGPMARERYKQRSASQ